MLFSSLPFLYYFLPAVMAVYFLVPRGARNTVLLLSSLIFYGWGEPRLLPLMAATIVLFYLCGLAIAAAPTPGGRRLWLALAVAGGLGALGLFKYGDFFVSTVNAVTGASLPLLGLALPVGISFYTFQCLSYVIDVYRGAVPAQRSLVAFGAYVALFPQLIAGPIVRYSDIARQLVDRTHTPGDFSRGLTRFLTGLGKKILLADNLALLVAAYRDAAQPSVLLAWLYALAFTLQIYFDFSGYSDMAIGLGRCFGFRFSENFDYPYLCRSVTEFWRRWHISLGSWFRDYVYIPLGGSRVSRGRWVGNILVVWLLTGLWHGAAWNFVAWGLLYAACLLAEKCLPALGRLWLPLRRGYTLLVVVLGFVIFNAGSLAQAGQDLAALAGLGGLPAVTQESLYYLRSFAPLLAVALLGATNVPKNAACALAQGRFAPALTLFWQAVMLVLCTAYLVDGSFSPFLYFRF